MLGVRGAPTSGCEHLPEHLAGTRALPSLSACLWRKAAPVPSTPSIPASLTYTQTSEHQIACACTCASPVHFRGKFHRHSPDTKATFSFRMGRTSEAFKPSFRKDPVRQQNRRNQGERGQMAESLGPILSITTPLWARELCLIQTLQSSPKEQERVYTERTLPHDARPQG